MEDHKVLGFELHESKDKNIIYSSEDVNPCYACKKDIPFDMLAYWQPETKMLVCERCMKFDMGWDSGVPGLSEVSYYRCTVKKRH
jgi:hypothetical protein